MFYKSGKILDWKVSQYLIFKNIGSCTVVCPAHFKLELNYGTSKLLLFFNEMYTFQFKYNKCFSIIL